jgi:hypothetical protein
MKRKLVLPIAGAGGLFVALAAVGWQIGWWGNSEAGRKHRVYDEKLQQEIETSTNINADRERMWQTVPSIGYPRSNFEVSPVSAINAAGRVFATIELRGKTAAEVANELGERPRPGYGYDFPFYPTEKGIMVFRFDCGSFGWQFNLVFDAEGRVQSVERHGIE